MKKQQNKGLDFIIDKLTNSIQNIVTGDNFATDIEIKSDHVYMHLVESAPFNKGKTKVYSGVLET